MHTGLRVWLVAAAVPLLGGCASIVNGTTHPMKIDTTTASGKAVAGAECKVSNDAMSQTVKSGETFQVQRSNKDLDIVCKQPGEQDAGGRAVSRVTPAMFGNILIGGVIGIAIDHARGAAYAYPSWIRMVFGQALSFDRRDEKEGQAVAGASAASAAEAGKRP